MWFWIIAISVVGVTFCNYGVSKRLTVWCQNIVFIVYLFHHIIIDVIALFPGMSPSSHVDSLDAWYEQTAFKLGDDKDADFLIKLILIFILVMVICTAIQYLLSLHRWSRFFFGLQEFESEVEVNEKRKLAHLRVECPWLQPLGVRIVEVLKLKPEGLTLEDLIKILDDCNPDEVEQ